MATRTTDKKIKMRGGPDGLSNAPAAASALLPHGTLAFRDSGGYATPTADVANPLLGMMHLRCDNSSGANGDKDAEFWITHRFQMTCDAVTQADIGKKAYAVDNQTASPLDRPGAEASATRAYIGTFTEYISATEAEVQIDTQAV